MRGNLSKAEMDFSKLVETHRDSPLRPQALAYALQAKNNNNPTASRTFELRLRSMIFSDGKPPELSFYLNRDSREFQDSGSAGSKPVASAVQVLIGSKVGKIADLSPGDTVTVQLSPDNKSITRIELNLKTMKARLDALDQEAEALRKRIQQLEKGK